MPNQQIFCERCGRMVSAAELHEGRYFRVPDGVLCLECAEALPFETRQQLVALVRQTPLPGKTPRTTPRPPSRQTPKPKPTPTRGSRRMSKPSGSGRHALRKTPSPSQRRTSERRKVTGTARKVTGSTRKISERRTTVRGATKIGERRISGAGTGTYPAAGTSDTKMMLYIGVGALGLIGAIAAIVLSQRKPPAPRKANASQAAATRSVASRGQSATTDAGLWATGAASEDAPADTVASRLDGIRRMMDPNLSRYEEMRTLLNEIVVAESGSAVAAQARTLLDDLEMRYGRLAEEKLASALQAAGKLSGQGEKEGAASILKAVRARFQGSAWLRDTGEAKIAAAIADLDSPAAAVAADAGGADAAAAAAGEAAEETTPAEATVDEPKLAWQRFLVALADAGKKGLKDASAHLEKEGAAFEGEPHGKKEKVRRLGSLVRRASSVHSLVEEGLVSSQRMVRLHWQGRPYSGKVAALKDGVVTLAPKIGSPTEIPVNDVPVGELLRASGMFRGSASDPLRAASYCLVRGDLGTAREYLAKANPDDAAELMEDLDELASAIRATRPKKPPVEEVAEEKPEEAAPTEVVAADPVPKPEPKVEEPPLEVKYPTKPLPGETGEPGQWAPGLVTRILGKKDECFGARIEPNLWRSYRGAEPDLDVPSGCSLEWSGWLLVPFTGPYVFELIGNKASMSLDGRPLLQSGHINDKRSSPERVYEMGLHPIKVVSRGKGVSVRLSWKSAGLAKTKIESDYFFHKVPQPGTVGPPARILPGLKAEYFLGENFERKVAESWVDSASYDIGEMPPCGLCMKDHFSIRLSGYLLLEASEEYEVTADAVNGVRLKIGDEMVINHWTANSTNPLKVQQQLEAGLCPMTLEYTARKGAAKGSVIIKRVKETWRGDIVPERIYRIAGEPVTVKRAGLIPGLYGRFFGTERFAGKPTLERYDPVVAFDWDGRPPAKDLPAEHFSAIWTGMLLVPEKGMYHFAVYHDDGVVVKINNRPVINKWSATAGWVYKSFPMRAGPAKIEISYFNRVDKSRLEILWAGPSFGFRPFGSGVLGTPADELIVAAPWKDEIVVPKRDPLAGGPKLLPGQKDPLLEKKKKPKVQEKPPEGNLVMNGGFENLGEGERLADRWKSHNWGVESAKVYARSDQSNPHEGDRAVMVRAMQDGALPGVYSSARGMPPAKYELRFWVCADIEKKAIVHAHLAGTDFPATTVGEDWQQLKFELVIDDEKRSNPAVKLWTSTAGVKVWFDDVEVEATGEVEIKEKDEDPAL